MSYVDKLKVQAVQRGLLEPRAEIDAPRAFTLVRDMPYKRASDRQPETLIHEWRGTCSGKHYLLKILFAELGFRARIIACTNEMQFDMQTESEEVRKILKDTNGRFVDVHNYLVLELPEGEMVVDATWPRSAKRFGLPVNESFMPGEDQQIACSPIETWVVPEDSDPQSFKQKLLQDNFTPEELTARDEFIRAMGDWMDSN